MSIKIEDISLLRDMAIKRYVDLTQTGRLPGMSRDLYEDERRAIAFLEASINTLNRLGVINQTALDKLDLRVITETIHHNVIDEEMEGVVVRK
jgi:hypothetical protein